VRQDEVWQILWVKVPLQKEKRFQIHRYYWKGVLWSPSYFAGSCGGAPITVIRQYIEQQQTPEI